MLRISLFVFFFINSFIVNANKNRSYATVLDFQVNKSVKSGFEGSDIAVILEEPLSYYYKLVDRLQISKAMTELKFQNSDMVDHNKIKKLGKLVGAEVIITGSVVQFGNNITITTKCINVETGEIKQTAKVSTTNISEIPNLAEIIVRRLHMTDAEKEKHIKSFGLLNQKVMISTSTKSIIDLNEKKSIIFDTATLNNLSEEEKSYVVILRSGNLIKIKKGIRFIYGTNDTVILDEVEKALLKAYKSNKSRTAIDALAWMCRTLGESQNSKYIRTLNTVKDNSGNRKLSGYAIKALRNLQ